VITSTLLTLVVIPTFYEILDEWREWVLRKVGIAPRGTGEHKIPPLIQQPEEETTTVQS
jgi:HAE1 family hydrophobic/amphiphilic exporter-1